ncbi:stealth family protein [Catellatospora sp. NPDC049133]|uniref:stealth family protein n=1 Tax=Catellatospora sp. NPDC049133 TaxID=3155499 RepID=UPI0033F9817D
MSPFPGLDRYYGVIFQVPGRSAAMAALSRRSVDLLLPRVRRAGGPAERWARSAVRWHLTSRYDTSELRLVPTAHGPALARPLTEATPLAARRLNLETVLTVLRDAGVEHFCVRGYDDKASAVAIGSGGRREAWKALRREALRRPLFVAAVTDQGVQTPMPATSHHAWRTLAGHRVIRLIQYVCDPSGSLLLGTAHGCDLEVWSRTPQGPLHAPRPNRAADLVPATGPVVQLDEAVFTRMTSAHVPGQAQRPTRAEFAGTLLDDITFPVDVVYTWVDDEDPAWQARRDAVLAGQDRPPAGHATGTSRFANHDELRYSMRSLHLYAPWVRRIWLVTDDQVPSWLDTCHDRVRVVAHKELFGDHGRLPTFNSHAIESRLHHVDGLSEHFVYFNDDVFVGRPVNALKFFQPNGLSKLFPSKGKVALGPADAADLAPTAAGKNNRALIARDFGRHLTYKMKHVPHALRRDVLAEMSDRYAQELERTAGNRFRDSSDVSLVSSAYHYYALATGRAAIDRITSTYVSLAAPDTKRQLAGVLARRDQDVFCVNDEDGTPEQRQGRQELLRDFLTAYFPVAAPWELTGPDAARQDG